MAVVDCSALAERNDFTTYAESLLNATNGSLYLLSPCRNEVCTAMWGAENSDVSGIGMIIGYILDQVLGLLLGMAVIATGEGRHPQICSALRRGLAVFHDCASFLAFSVEIASTVLLIKVDAGISTSGMGNYTVQIVFAVAMLVLLPLVYSILATSADRDSAKPKAQVGGDTGRSRCLTLFVVCWALAFYPFFSAMNAAFGPSKVSNRQDAALSIEQLQTIEDICFQDVRPINEAEARLMISFILLTYIPLSLVLVASIIWSGIKTNHEGSAAHRLLLGLHNRLSDRAKQYGMMICLAAVPSLAAGLLWVVFRAREAQEQLLRSLEQRDEGNGWTFGQVAAVTLFAPVAFECWNGFVSYRKGLAQDSDEDIHAEGGSK